MRPAPLYCSPRFQVFPCHPTTSLPAGLSELSSVAIGDADTATWTPRDCLALFDALNPADPETSAIAKTLVDLMKLTSIFSLDDYDKKPPDPVDPTGSHSFFPAASGLGDDVFQYLLNTESGKGNAYSPYRLRQALLESFKSDRTDRFQQVVLAGRKNDASAFLMAGTLHILFKHKDRDFVQRWLPYFLQAGARWEDCIGTTALDLAFRMGHDATGGNGNVALIDVQDKHGHTALSRTVFAEPINVKNALRLLEHGAKPDAHLACHSSTLSKVLYSFTTGELLKEEADALIRAMLEAGADPYKMDADGWDPLAEAVITQHPPWIDLLFAARRHPLFTWSRVYDIQSYCAFSLEDEHEWCSSSTRRQKRRTVKRAAWLMEEIPARQSHLFTATQRKIMAQSAEGFRWTHGLGSRTHPTECKGFVNGMELEWAFFLKHPAERSVAWVQKNWSSLPVDQQRYGLSQALKAESPDGDAVFRTMIQQGTSLRITLPSGLPLLLAAALLGRTEAMRLLLDAGANPEQTNSWGISARSFLTFVAHHAEKHLRLAAATAPWLTALSMTSTLPARPHRTAMRL